MTTDHDYLPSEAQGKRSKSTAELTGAMTPTKRLRLGTGVVGQSSTTRLRRMEDPFDDESSGRRPQVDGQRPSTSRIQAKLDKYTHICQPCRELFNARSKPLVGSALIGAAGILYAWYLGTDVFTGGFWMLVMNAAALVFIAIGVRHFFVFTQCPRCNSERTSRLDSAHGRQIRTETVVRTETSYIRKQL